MFPCLYHMLLLSYELVGFSTGRAHQSEHYVHVYLLQLFVFLDLTSCL